MACNTLIETETVVLTSCKLKLEQGYYTSSNIDIFLKKQPIKYLRMGLPTLLIKTGITIVLLLSTCFSCEHGYFGLDCKDKCSTYCSGNGSCSPDKGVCNNGCKEGWSGPKCGTRTDADGSTHSTITISVAVCSGVAITTGVAVFLTLLRRRKDFCRKKPSNENHAGSSHTSHVPPIYNYHVQNALFVQGDCLEDVQKGIKGNLQNFNLLAINPSA